MGAAERGVAAPRGDRPLTATDGRSRRTWPAIPASAARRRAEPPAHLASRPAGPSHVPVPSPGWLVSRDTRWRHTGRDPASVRGGVAARENGAGIPGGSSPADRPIRRPMRRCRSPPTPSRARPVTTRARIPRNVRSRRTLRNGRQHHNIGNRFILGIRGRTMDGEERGGVVEPEPPIARAVDTRRGPSGPMRRRHRRHGRRDPREAEDSPLGSRPVGCGRGAIPFPSPRPIRSPAAATLPGSVAASGYPATLRPSPVHSTADISMTVRPVHVRRGPAIGVRRGFRHGDTSHAGLP